MSDKLNVLIIGNGGREHAYGWKVKQSSRCGELYFMPGNGGTQGLGTNVPVATNWDLLPDFVHRFKVDLVIVGAEQPLADGIVDILRAAGIQVVGSTQRAAKLETSKVFAKTLMGDYGIATASFQIFDDYARAISYVRAQRRPLYIKASGLCNGKGAFQCGTVDEALLVLHRLMVERTLGSAGDEVIIEEFLNGDELSVHAFCDGDMFALAPPTRDHKKLLGGGETLPDGTNPQTGGMGAFGPVSISESQRDAIDLIVEKTLWGLKDRIHEPYTGILYPGLMMTAAGPQVLEFNVRGGDPETQVLMRLLKSDALDLFEALATGGLPRKIEWHDGYAVCVVLVSDGYPGKYEVGFPISGIEVAEWDKRIKVFHAGTRYDRETGEYFTAGGRVLNVTAHGSTFEEAISAAYKAVDLISFQGMRYRKDIGADIFAAV